MTALLFTPVEQMKTGKQLLASKKELISVKFLKDKA